MTNEFTVSVLIFVLFTCALVSIAALIIRNIKKAEQQSRMDELETMLYNRNMQRYEKAVKMKSVTNLH